MADEITASVYLKFDKNSSAAVDIDSGDFNVTVTGDNAVYNIQEVGTSAENLIVGDVGTAGYILAHNLGATNFCTIGYDDSGYVPCVKVSLGKWVLFEFPAEATTPQAKADTGAIKLEYYLIEA